MDIRADDAARQYLREDDKSPPGDDILTEKPKLLGVYKEKNVYLHYSKFGQYLKYDCYNYSIPNWAKKEQKVEMLDLHHAIKIIDWKNNRKSDAKETRNKTCLDVLAAGCSPVSARGQSRRLYKDS